LSGIERITLVDDTGDYEHSRHRSVASVLYAARQQRMTEIVIIGVRPNGDLFLRGFPPEPAKAAWLMERAKQALLDEAGD
jgi:hypothetical protein